MGLERAFRMDLVGCQRDCGIEYCLCLFPLLQKTDNELQKLHSENYLLNVRLDSMSEILSLQEADITKVQCRSSPFSC